MAKRTHTCGELRLEHAQQTVTLNGWVNNYRDHGGVIFIDLRDREGVTQCVFHPENAEAHKKAERLRHEDVVGITGVVLERGIDDNGKSLANPKLPTGSIEIDGKSLEVLNKSATPPFTPFDADKVNEETRLRYRYVDLRRPRMQEMLRLRHRVCKVIRDYCDEHGFLEIETPFLCRSTPEGARDFLVPSRVYPGEFYALPQSPQLYKQVLMASGAEKYVQIVRCFRDEDPRADRVAEFTQIDLEMSFVEPEDVMELTEGMIRRVWQEVAGIEVPPVKRMDYATAMEKYGTDRPDLRYDLEIQDVTEVAKGTDFKVFLGAIENGGKVKAIRVPGGAKMTRKQTDGMAEWVKQFGLGGLPVVKYEGGELTTGISKFLASVKDALVEALGLEDGDFVAFGVSDNLPVLTKALGELRQELARTMELIDPDKLEWLWVVDFPLIEWDPAKKRWDSLHHPFTAPTDADLDKLETDPGNIKSKAYDLVLNGSELGGGSVRIHRPETQQRVFKLLGIDEEEAEAKFGFLLGALKFGAPPHGGLAFGLDRMIMQLMGTNNIRDVIAFPKTQTGQDLMTEAPSPVGDDQLLELELRHVAPPKAPTAAQ